MGAFFSSAQFLAVLHISVEMVLAFNILSISGGGFRGLYSAAVLAELEESSGIPLRQRFDLIAGTSIGGILALGLAAGKPAAAMVDSFKKNGHLIFSASQPPKSGLGKTWAMRKNALKAKYKAENLRKVVADLVGEETLIADLKQRVVVPAVNLSKGSPQVFKTAHHETFVRDFKLRVVDVAMATSAAPTYFPIHKIGSEMFADGGMYANSPDEIALHEAQHFLGQRTEEISMLSIGTTTSKFSFSGAVDANLGWLSWMGSQELPGIMIGAQQMNADYVLRHKLSDRYLRIDEDQSAEQAKQLALDLASPSAIQTLLGFAEASVRRYEPSEAWKAFMLHEAPEQDFLGKGGVS